MTANECITGRRSIRRFTEQPVSHELLQKIVETASFAPSWKNTQITRYIAVEDEKKAALAKCTSLYPGNGAIMEQAPMVIAVTAVKGRSGYERDGSFSTPKGAGWQMYDAGVASEAFCLAAYEQGLGTVIMGLFDEADAAKVLDLPDDRELVALIPIGYPAEAPAAPRRKTVEELLSFQS
ncbi:MAG: nitroreductase family protein [Firmicutes bacterium]|nr:nitroreductase family protein [Bacillota bacterium]